MDSQGRQVSVCRWYVYDGLGSVVGEADPSGNLTSSPKYDVYGAVRGNAGAASSRQGFVGGLGHVSDAKTGLVYMRARYYDPSNGRFESEDPAQNGANWFIYCDNNPVNEVDKTGKDAEWWNQAAFDIGATLGYIAIFAAMGAGNPIKGDTISPIKYATTAILLTIAATAFFGIAMAGLTNAYQDVLLAVQGGLLGTLATMVTFAGEAGKTNLPGVQLAVGAAFNYGLIAISIIATSNGDY